MPDDPSDLEAPDIDGTDSAVEIYERLEAYESSGGDVDALLTSEDAEVVSAPERPARPDSEVGDVGSEPVEQEASLEPDAEREPAPVDEGSPEPESDPDPDLTARAPKPDFDPEKLTTEEGRLAYEYAERLRRYQQGHYAKKINTIIGGKKPDEAREILSRWDTLNSAPELEAARTLIRGSSEYGSFAEALLNRNHPSHEIAVARYQRAVSDAPADDPRQDEELVRTVMDPETGDIDPRRVKALLQRVRENALSEAPRATAPNPTSFEAWAAANAIPDDDRLEMSRLWEQDHRPAFPDATRVQYFVSLKDRLAAERTAEWEQTRVKELQRHVSEAQPKPRSVGPGMKGQKIDLEKYDDPIEIANAIENGTIDIDDPYVKRLAGLD